MATIPTPEKLARELLTILRDDNNRVGEGTTIQALHSQFGFNRPGQDFQAGVDYAQQQGWVNLINDGRFVTFTQEGFEEA